MPWGSREKPSVNPMTKLPPKAPSALVRTTRWVGFGTGILYGAWRLSNLRPKQEAVRDSEKLYFEFVKARVAKYWLDKSIEDMIVLKRDAEGLPHMEFAPLDRPLLVDEDDVKK